MILKINKKAGFTLLEILLVVGIIALLAGIVIVAINPARQLASVRNAERKSDIKQIDSAITQYYIDNFRYPTGLTGTLKGICDTGSTPSPSGVTCTNLVDLSALVPDYITAIPTDPQASTTNTGYYVKQDSTTHKIGVQADLAELDQDIVVGMVASSTGNGGIGDQGDKTIVLANDTRTWSDSTYAGTCNDYKNPASSYTYSGDTGDGVYTIDPSGSNPFDVFCDMTTNGGGWTLVMHGDESLYVGFTTASAYHLENAASLTAGTFKYSDADINALRQNSTVYWAESFDWIDYDRYFSADAIWTVAEVTTDLNQRTSYSDPALTQDETVGEILDGVGGLHDVVGGCCGVCSGYFYFDLGAGTWVVNDGTGNCMYAYPVWQRGQSYFRLYLR